MQEVAVLIASLVTMVAALSAAAVAVITALKTPAAIRKVEGELASVRVHLNSRLTELLAAVKGRAEAEGVAKGRSQEKAEKDATETNLG